jgi:hypothetical protein
MTCSESVTMIPQRKQIVLKVFVPAIIEINGGWVPRLAFEIDQICDLWINREHTAGRPIALRSWSVARVAMIQSGGVEKIPSAQLWHEPWWPCWDQLSEEEKVIPESRMDARPDVRRSCLQKVRGGDWYVQLL